MLDGKVIEKILCYEAETETFDLIDSTNSEAKRRALSLADSGELIPRLFIAKEQSAGRGRMGRAFLSRGGRGLYFSLLYFTDKPLQDAVSVTTAAAAAVALAIERATGRVMRIKWVNDIYNERGKVCGILAESLVVGDGRLAMVVGVGINVGEDDFPEELKNIASSVGELHGGENALVADIVKGLLSHAKNPEDRGFMQDYRKRLMLEGESVDLLQAGEIICSGVVRGVDDDGGLLLVPHGKSEVVTVRSGEVSVRLSDR